MSVLLIPNPTKDTGLAVTLPLCWPGWACRS